MIDIPAVVLLVVSIIGAIVVASVASVCVAVYSLKMSFHAKPGVSMWSRPLWGNRLK